MIRAYSLELVLSLQAVTPRPSAFPLRVHGAVHGIAAQRLLYSDGRIAIALPSTVLYAECLT